MTSDLDVNRWLHEHASSTSQETLHGCIYMMENQSVKELVKKLEQRYNIAACEDITQAPEDVQS